MNRLRTVVLDGLDQRARGAILERSAVPDRAVRDGAAAIVDDVGSRGDAAVIDLAARFGGGFRPVGDDELSLARNRLPDSVISSLERAADAIRTFHMTQLPRDASVETAPGVEIRRRWTPLTRVGAYVPGGRAAYPSTVLMTVVPARVAGVDQVVVASPEAPDGSVHPATLAACSVAGATEVWAMGGAQAIAAMAHGTESVERVQKIVGPGNAWVTAAKIAVFGICAIDLPAGPSEVLVLADSESDPVLVAADLLCQAEHGPDSPAVLLTTDPSLPDRVEAELGRMLRSLERADILERALTDHGLAVIASERSDALEFANEYAAEHVSIMTADPDRDAKEITGAGSVYIGRFSPESAGDYATGANHVLPTGGLAAACGPLAVEDFGSWRQEQRITRAGLEGIVDVITTLSDAEGLTAHGLAARIRLRSEGAT